MIDRITVERLVSTGEFEHLTIRVERDVVAHDNEGLRVEVNVLEQLVRRWAALARKREDLERRLEDMRPNFELYGDGSEEMRKIHEDNLRKLADELAKITEEWA